MKKKNACSFPTSASKLNDVLLSCWTNWVLCFRNKSYCKSLTYSALWRSRWRHPGCSNPSCRGVHTLSRLCQRHIWNEDLMSFVYCVRCDINLSFCTVIGTAGSMVHMHAVSMASPAVLLTDYMSFVMQVRYKEDYEKNKGKAFTQVADDPEMMRVKKTQQQVSGVSVRSSVPPFPSSSSYLHKSQPPCQTTLSECPSITPSCVMNLSSPCV